MADVKTILVAEDNSKNMKLFYDLLELTEKYSVVVAENGKQAVETAKQHVPDLIILDWHMPVMGGKEAISILKSFPKTSCIPILVVTASAMSNEVLEIRNSGCDDYLLKPFDISDFLQKVLDMLERSDPGFKK